MNPFKCKNCDQELRSSDEVVNHIASFHAQGIPLSERQKWFEQDKNEMANRAPQITEG